WGGINVGWVSFSGSTYSVHCSGSPNAQLWADTDFFTSGPATTNLHWTSVNASSCTASGASDFTGPIAINSPSGGVPVSLSATTNYSIVCGGPGTPAFANT